MKVNIIQSSSKFCYFNYTVEKVWYDNKFCQIIEFIK